MTEMIRYNDNMRSIPLTKPQLDRMESLYLDGESTRDLVAIYGMSQSAILRRLRSIGVKIRPRGKPPRP